MNKKNKIILSSIFVTIIIITILFIFIYNKIEFAFGLKYNKEDVIEEYKKNKALFLSSINEIMQEENICFTKNNDKIIIRKYCFDKEKQINISNRIEKEKYEDTLKIMNKSMIKSIIKKDENIEYAVSSPYGMDQYVVYLKNKEQYYFGRKVIKRTKIDNTIYYVETD